MQSINDLNNIYKYAAAGPSSSELITIQWQSEGDDLDLQNFLLAISASVGTRRHGRVSWTASPPPA